MALEVAPEVLLVQAAHVVDDDVGLAGRGDLVATGGDLPAQNVEAAAFTQCWAGPTFDSVFEQLTVLVPEQGPYVVQTDGDEAACVFAESTDPNVPELGAEPQPEDGDIPSESTIY